MAITKITCCKDCATRHPGCHGTCEKYLEQRAEFDEWKEEQRKQQDIKNGLDNFLFDCIERTNRQINYRSKFKRKR